MCGVPSAFVVLFMGAFTEAGVVVSCVMAFCEVIRECYRWPNGPSGTARPEHGEARHATAALSCRAT